jgi:hypothetical protein
MQLQQIYGASLHHLLLCLVAITLLSAVVVLLTLAGKETATGSDNNIRCC